MAQERLDLETAGKLFGITANAMRARAKKDKAKYRPEADNTGKLWVWIDTEKAANDRALKAEMKPSMKGEMNPQNSFTIKALQASIETLNEELKAARAETATWRAKAEERAEVAHRLEVSIAALTAKDAAGERERAELRELLDRQTDESRKMLADAFEKMAAMASRTTQESRGWISRLLGRRSA